MTNNASPPPPLARSPFAAGASAFGSPTAMNLMRAGTFAVSTLRQLGQRGTFLDGLAALLTEAFSELSADEQRRLLEAALAGLTPEEGPDSMDATDAAMSPAPAAVDYGQARASISVVFELVRRGQVASAVLEGPVTDDLRRLAGQLSTLAKPPGAALGTPSAHGQPQALTVLLRQHDLLRIPPEAMVEKILRDAGPAASGGTAPQGSAGADRVMPATQVSRFIPRLTLAGASESPSPAAGSTPSGLPSGIERVLELVANVDVQLNSILDGLDLANGDISPARLASLEAQLQQAQMQLDIALGTLEQLTTFFQKIGRSFNA